MSQVVASSSSNANAVEPLTPTASILTLDTNLTILPSNQFDQPFPDDSNPLRHSKLLAPWPLLRIITKNDMNAIVATRHILKGESIALFYGDVQTTPSMYTLQVDDNLHVTCSLGGPTYTNHSCEPNAFFAMDHITPRAPFPCLTALKDIAEGDEITFHYCHNEWSMAVPFFCLCHTPSCSGKIEGFSKLNLEMKRKFQPYLSPCIARKWREEEEAQGAAVAAAVANSSK